LAGPVTLHALAGRIHARSTTSVSGVVAAVRGKAIVPTKAFVRVVIAQEE
jgi:hypothetical protein